MATYKLEWKKSAVKELKSLPGDLVARILQAVGTLNENPFPHGVKKLSGSEHSYRIREGSHRIIYTVTKRTLVVEIVKIGNRKDVYEK
jgi:mRNA interferase RelE/StbE